MLMILQKLIKNASIYIFALALLFSSFAFAQTISVKGVAGKKALISVNNGQPVFMNIGEKIGNFEITEVIGQEVSFKSDTESFLLKVGLSRLDKNLSPKPNKSETDTLGQTAVQPQNSGGRLVVPASGTNHSYITDGFYDSKPVKFILDTGANMVSVSINDAQRLGINYTAGKPAFADTAGGRVNAFIVTAPSITVGPITLNNIDVIVTSTSFAQPNTLLLGQSFLSKLRLVQEAGQMILESK